MIACTPWIERLEKELPVVLARSDPESVHHLRVAAGRLAVWLELDRRHVLRDDLRWLRRSLGPVRDLDVLLAAHAGAEWAESLKEEREERRRELAVALASARVAGLIAALRLLPPLAPDKARAGLARLRRRVLRAGARLGAEEGTLEELHRLRRRLRHLRYAHEWLGEDQPGLVELQDALGELNNLAVAARHLEQQGGAGAMQTASDEIAGALKAQRAAALAAWERTRPELASAA